MNRRDFLSLAAKIAVAAAMPKTAFAGEDKAFPSVDEINRSWDFDPKVQYGNVILITEELTPEGKLKAIMILKENMNNIVPPKYRHKVTYPDRLFGYSGAEDPFNEIATIAWKYTP